jgi:EAL domain-containing protein (putative c-di-GMP-specific phosphodiesterase class I)
MNGLIGIRVVAEGVEDDETWEALSAVGCELIQGYALSRPVPAAELEQALNAKPHGRTAAPFARPAPEPLVR